MPRPRRQDPARIWLALADGRTVGQPGPWSSRCKRNWSACAGAQSPGAHQAVHRAHRRGVASMRAACRWRVHRTTAAGSTAPPTPDDPVWAQARQRTAALTLPGRETLQRVRRVLAAVRDGAGATGLPAGGAAPAAVLAQAGRRTLGLGLHPWRPSNSAGSFASRRVPWCAGDAPAQLPHRRRRQRDGAAAILHPHHRTTPRTISGACPAS